MTRPELTLIARNDTIARPAFIDHDEDESSDDFSEVIVRARPGFVFFSADSEAALHNMVWQWVQRCGSGSLVSEVTVAASTFSVDGKYRTTVNYVVLEEVVDP